MPDYPEPQDLAVVDSAQLLRGLRANFFEIQALVEESNQEDRDSARRLLGQVMLLVRDGKQVAEWPVEVSEAFILLLYDAVNSSAPFVAEGEVNGGCLRFLDIAQASCNLAAQASSLGDRTKIKAQCLWPLSQFLLRAPFFVMEEFVSAAAMGLARLNMQPEISLDVVRFQSALHIAKWLQRDGRALALQELVRNWCHDLSVNPHISPLLAETNLFDILGISVPESKQEQSPKDKVDAGPGYWPLPKINRDIHSGPEWGECLFELQAFTFAAQSPLSEMTTPQIQRLRPQMGIVDLSRPFFFAAGDLWNGFSTTGNRDFLVVSQKIASLLLSYEQSLDDPRRERFLNNAVNLWLRTQLPTLINVCNIPLIISDAHKLFSRMDWKPRDQFLRLALIEAYAGECRRFEAEGDDESRTSLLQENADHLKKIHQQYVDRCQASNVRPSTEEGVAWDYISRQLDSLSHTGDVPSGGTSRVHGGLSSLGAHNSILDDQTFAHVIRKGAHQTSYDLITDRLEEIRDLLMRRLDVRLLPEYLMAPEGRVFSPNATFRGQADPAFAEAEKAIEKSEFHKSTEILQRLANRVQGRPREFCRSWQAYALARNEELLLARQCLQELVASRFPYSSAYWNLACCLPPEQMERQLDVLATGLEIAPHPQILHGAVFLALVMNDSRVTQWLLYLTLPEALLLAFQQRFEEMSAEDRDASLLRLNYYLKHGEPVALDPTDHGIPYQVASSYLNDLIQRQQLKAADFWLRCRESVGLRRFDYWQLKVALLHQTGRQVEAARAFQKELQCRLEALARRKFIKGNSPAEVTQRASDWLRQCMTPELRETGRDIFRSLVVFSNEQSMSVIPRDTRIQKYFSDQPRVSPALGRTGGVVSNLEVEKVAGAERSHPPERLGTLLAEAGRDCSRDFHEIEHIFRVDQILRKLLSGFRNSGRMDAADRLVALVSGWREYGKETGRDERQQALVRLQHLYAEFKEALRRELSPEELVTAHLLLESFRRANERLARSLDLLPKLSIEPLEGNLVLVPPLEDASFPVRVRSTNETATVRLSGASASLSSGLVDLILRDQLNEIEVTIGPDKSAVLTFSIPGGMVVSEVSEASITVSYEYAGETFLSPPSLIRLAPDAARTVIAAQSPFIFGRPLEPNEIEKHFFGRESEQEAIFDSIRDGQQRLYYIEGIRRTGKSSLLKSIQYEIERRGLSVLAVYVSAQAVGRADSAGRVLHNFFREIAGHEGLAPLNISVPEEEDCVRNMPRAFSEFLLELQLKIASGHVLVLLDDFQMIVEQASAAAEFGGELGIGISTLLNLIRQHAGPKSPLLWLFAGHRAKRQFRSMVPGVLLFADLRSLRVDFLSRKAIRDLIATPLREVGIEVPEETLDRVHFHTAGHPEVAQEMGDVMFNRSIHDGRQTLTPADADYAAREIASSTDSFADTWYPIGELSREQRALIGAFINAAPLGGSIDPRRLSAGQHLTDAQEQAIDDLAARKVIEYANGEMRIKSFILDLWLRRTVPAMITEAVNGSVAIFIDVANLTAGKGTAVISGLSTPVGEHGIPGQFDLETVLDKIVSLASKISPAPIAARWVVNYPRNCPAVVVCSAKNFYVENIPAELWAKGSDDLVLAAKMWEVQDQYSTINHFVLVLGDKDYKGVAIDRLLKDGKYVHLISRKESLAKEYEYLAATYPDRFILKTLEELLE